MNYVKHPLTIVVVLVITLPVLASATGVGYSVATEVLVWAIVGLGFNLLLGYAGLLSLGHGAFFGVAAYTAAIFQIHFVRDTFMPVLAGVLVGTAVGAVEGFLVLRRRGVYFSLLTLVFAQLFFYVAFGWTELTGGASGLSGYRRLSVLGFVDVSSADAFYYFVALFVVLLGLAMWRVVRSPFGSVLRATRQNEPRVRALGYDTQRYLWLAFVISAAFASVAGSLYAFALQSLPAHTLSLGRSFEIAALTVIGGAASFVGPIIGAAFLVLLRQGSLALTENWLFVFAATSMLFAVLAPAGIVGLAQALWGIVRPRPTPPPTPTPLRPISGASEDAAPEPPRPPLGEEILVCSAVVKRFGGVAAVNGVDLSVRRGELHSLVGPNGAGKSTLLDCLLGLPAPDAGSVVFAGQEIAGKAPHEVARLGIARSFEKVGILQDLTVFENVRLAAQAKSKHAFGLIADPAGLDEVNAKAREALTAVGLAGVEKARAGDLSRGDQRLLELAMCLATEPSLLALDEPLADLSPAERGRLAGLIRRLASERAVLLAEHDLDRVLELSDRITVLRQGVVVASGTPQQLRGNPAAQPAGLERSQLEEARLAAKRARAGVRETLLRVDRITTLAGQRRLLSKVSLEVREGEAVCLLGRNGVGKTTTLASIAGALPPKDGQVYFAGEPIAGLAPEVVARQGLALVPQGRRIFPNLTVADNLAIARREHEEGPWNLKSVYQHFPRLKQIRDLRGDKLTAGEQQLLAIARALMANPDLILLDEALEGLHPTDLAEVARVIQQLRGKVSILMAEQNASLALALCDRAYVLSGGRIIWEGAAQTLAEDNRLRAQLLAA